MRRTVVRSFSIKPKLLKELEETAEEENRTYSELVREAIRQYLKNKQLDEIHLQTLTRGLSAPRPSVEDIQLGEVKTRRITTAVSRRFRTLGGGRHVQGNPLAEALKDRPPQFAGGVSVEEVVRFVLEEAEK